MYFATIANELSPTPAWLPQRSDAGGQCVRLVRFGEGDYRDAPFLDDRGFPPDAEQAVLPWREVEAAVPPGARRDAHFLFHMGRVGSTLLSRLLAECGPVLPLREPLPLMGLMMLDGDRARVRRDALRALYARTFDPGQRAMVKATSIVSEIAADLCGPAADGSRAALIGTRASSFIVARLAGSADELRARHAQQLARLRRRLPAVDAEQAETGPARLAAVSWAAEAMSLSAAAEALGARAHTVDFQAFLNRPAEELAALAGHFDLAPGDDHVRRLIEGPLMRRYSKRTGRDFDPAERAARLADAARRHDADIGKALEWLDGLARGSPSLAAAIDRFGA